ncbi:hypothetical protein HDU84_002434 [Entophlyctis sp. JEL0112]|nr:hypothetical protein HDU84_002434 [Entophlyctis sp. JEL0112]
MENNEPSPRPTADDIRDARARLHPPLQPRPQLQQSPPSQRDALFAELRLTVARRSAHRAPAAPPSPPLTTQEALPTPSRVSTPPPPPPPPPPVAQSGHFGCQRTAQHPKLPPPARACRACSRTRPASHHSSNVSITALIRDVDRIKRKFDELEKSGGSNSARGDIDDNGEIIAHRRKAKKPRIVERHHGPDDSRFDSAVFVFTAAVAPVVGFLLGYTAGAFAMA